MHRKKAGLTAGLVAAAIAAGFSGESALEFTRKAVAFGPRPPGSAAIRQLQVYIRSQLSLRRCEVTEDVFTARTPVGPIEMRNIIARFAGTSGRAVAITGHYDTKMMPGIRFVGANDGGSSTGLLLEMARVLAGRPRIHDVYLVFFDGEEAIGEWSAVDGLHGSRHLAERWARDGTLSRLRALINVDMIGDRDLGILQEMNSSAPLRSLIWQVAYRMGYGRYFLREGGAVEDDHMPFVRAGVSAVDLIDFDYGPSQATWWHTDRDTMDKLSAHSFRVVGEVLLETLRELESRK